MIDKKIKIMNDTKIVWGFEDGDIVFEDAQDWAIPVPAPVVQYEIDPEAIHLWWISFATPNQFQGAVIVEAMNAEDALAETVLAGLNPGGEAKIVFIPPAEQWRVKPDEKYRLLNREESLEFDKRQRP